MAKATSKNSSPFGHLPLQYCMIQGTHLIVSVISCLLIQNCSVFEGKLRKGKYIPGKKQGKLKF